MRAVVGVVALECRDISVAAAVNQAIRIGNDRRSGERLILAVGRGDRDGSREAEPVRTESCRSIEQDDGRHDVRLDRRQTIEERRVADAFAAARVADDRDAIEIDLAVEPMAGRRVPGAKLLEVLEVHDAPRVVFTEVAPVQEVDVDRGADHPVRGEKLTQIEVPGRRVLERPVVPVGEHHQRERPSPARNADVPVQRHAGVGERPRCRSPRFANGEMLSRGVTNPAVGRVVDVVLGERRHAGVVAPRRRIDDGVERQLHQPGRGFAALPSRSSQETNHCRAITTALVESNCRAAARVALEPAGDPASSLAPQAQTRRPSRSPTS